MRKLAIVYWSGTGNTEAMAQAIEKGAKEGGAETTLVTVGDFGADKMTGFDGYAFGCPAMGDEVLEEGEFEPFFEEAEKKLSGVPTVLFGSYGWGGGAWMEAWVERTKAAGAKLFSDGLTAENTPDDDALAACEKLGKDFAAAL